MLDGEQAASSLPLGSFSSLPQEYKIPTEVNGKCWLSIEHHPTQILPGRAGFTDIQGQALAVYELQDIGPRGF